MNKKMKKTGMAVISAFILTIGSTAAISASAYAPTITQTFSVGDYRASAVLYCDGSKANARTSLSNANCTVTLNYDGMSNSVTARDTAYTGWGGTSLRSVAYYEATAANGDRGGYCMQT
ncbi:MAG: hypothetical protein IJ265_03540 [Oscillospiraceae bacterium]|nr:hypothetical protein [Oscillospiraceae bacterium]